MLYLASDHAGFKLKEYLIHELAKRSIPFEDFGAYTDDETDDFTSYAKRVSKAVLKRKGEMGILICGTGIGMSIAANRYNGIRAAVVWEQEAARRAREEDDANIACLPARLITNQMAWEVVSTFLSTTFTHLERYKRRIKQTDEY